jgi:hypothetical protein
MDGSPSAAVPIPGQEGRIARMPILSQASGSQQEQKIASA